MTIDQRRKFNVFLYQHDPPAPAPCKRCGVTIEHRTSRTQIYCEACRPIVDAELAARRKAGHRMSGATG